METVPPPAVRLASAQDTPLITALPLAVRVYPEPPHEPVKPSRRMHRRSDVMLVFDTETRTDATQRLTFGSYRFLVRGECLEEGLFYADDLPARDLALLRAYVRSHRPNVAKTGNRVLQLLTRRQFLDKFYEVGYQTRSLIVGFNLPFDLSRLAVEVGEARGFYTGGFSLGLWEHQNPKGFALDPYRPRVGIKHIDSKRALIGFTGRHGINDVDLIPEGSATGTPDKHYVFPGHFLDLRRLAFALTDRGHTLASACKAFDVEHGKQQAAKHGQVTSAYIDYNRRDVLATTELAFKLLAEYDRHPIPLAATKAYSPASLGKAYLRAMGIPPVLERQPEFSRTHLGYAQSAFFGGRTSAHIRKCLVPIVYTDFLSMYPTVNRLMNLWRLVTAREIRIQPCTARTQRWLRRLTVDQLFQPKTWQGLNVFVRLVPNGDVLPIRAQFADSHDWQVAVNHVYSNGEALWYALADVAASVIRTGRVPTILGAFALVPHGRLDTLTPTKLRGVVDINPAREDFFQKVIEERKRLAARRDLSPSGRARHDKGLKVLANGTSFGIYGEMNLQESSARTTVRCHGLDPEPYYCEVAHPEIAGEYCFPPFASLITSAARLMLMLLEHEVATRGGTYAMEDTDSMAIVATERGGCIACPGGTEQLPTGEPAIRALSWADLRAITKRFETLNPYDRSAIPGSILKIEDDNFDPKTKRQRQIYCYAISAKRYALFVKDRTGAPVVLRDGVNNDSDGWSEHGLGHLLNPTDPDSDDRKWIATVWDSMARRAEGLRARPAPFAHRPAVAKLTVSSPPLRQPFAALNRKKAYADQIKPFNFGQTCFMQKLGQPSGTTPGQFHLFTPYEPNAARWERLEWIDRYSGKTFRITTVGQFGNRQTARVKTYGEVLAEYENHPESKNADHAGERCTAATIGLLQRRHIRIGRVANIGKESNQLEDVEVGLANDASAVYVVYPDPRRDEWQETIVPALHKLSLRRFEKLTGRSRRVLIDARRGRRRTQQAHRQLLASLVAQLNLK